MLSKVIALEVELRGVVSCVSDEQSVCLTAYQTVRTLIVLVTVVVLFIFRRKCCQELQVVLFRDLFDTL